MMIERRWLLATLSICLVMYVLLGLRFADRLDPLTGDEPFYVMTAISILRDGDLDESNNYADRDYEEFYPSDPLPAGWNGWPSFPRTLPPHPAVSRLDGIHTKHGLGVSFLIAGPYESSGRAGAMAVIIGFAMMAAYNMFRLARETGASPLMAGLLSTGLAITPPIVPYAPLIFPEIPAAALLIYAIRRLGLAQSNSTRDWLLTGLAIGYLPWLHQRFAPTAALLTVITLVLLWRNWSLRNTFAALTPVGVAGALLIAYNFWLYGQPLQNTADHAGFNSIPGTLNASFGLLLDAQWGLLVVAPVYLLAMVGGVHWVRANKVGKMALAVAFPYLVVVAAYNVWWGEWGPAARYLVPLAPLAIAGLVHWLPRTGNVGLGLTIAGFAWSGLLMLIGYLDPQRLYHHPTGVNNLYVYLGDRIRVPLDQWLVAFQPYAVDSLRVRFVFGLMLTSWFVSMLLWSMAGPGRRRGRPAR